MLSLVSQLEGDLRSISIDSRSKFPEVKEAAERALLRLRSTVDALPTDATPARHAASLAEAEEILLPFLLALATRSDGLALLALTGVQRMISHNALAPARLPAVASQLIARAQHPSAEEPSLLRVLQTVLVIASSPSLLHADSTILQMLLLCLSLQQSRSATIKNTASATVQQFVALLLDAVVQEAQRQGGTDAAAAAEPGGRPDLAALSVTSRCAFLAVQDLCILANGEPAQWLVGSGPVSVPFALEVIQRTLRSHSTLFLRDPPFQFLLQERVCPLVLRTMQQPQQDWAVALRLCHLTCTLLTVYSSMLRTESEILLSMLAKALMTESAPIWQRALSLETFRVVLQDAALVRNIFTTYDSVASSSNVFAGLAMSVCSMIRSPAVKFSEHAEYIEDSFMKHYRSASQGKPPAFNLTLYSDADGSQISNDYAAALAVECQVFLTRTIHSLASPFSYRTSDDAAAIPPPDPDGGVEIVRQMVGASWQPLLGALSLLLARCSSEEAVQVLLKCYQSYTQACAILRMATPRDEFLASLCFYALPPRARSEGGHTAAGMSFAPVDAVYEPLPNTTLSAKNVQALKAVFNIAHCMGGLLDEAWNLILHTFEQLDRIIASSKTTASSARAVELATAVGGPDGTTNELKILSTALDNLFSGSARLDDEAISHFLTALSTQCFSSLAHEATSKEKVAAPGSAAAQPPRLFALSRFMDTVLTNLHRIETLWPLVTQFLLPVANHKSQRIRVIGMESLAKVVVAAMRRKLKEGGGDGAEGGADGADGDGWDRMVLAPLEELQRRCAYRETQERILQATHQLLQACGKGLVQGWQLVLSVLWRAATKPSLVPLLPLAFRSVQLIASDFLSVLPPACLLGYIEVTTAYAIQTHHLNVALTAIGLQWTISDFVTEYGRVRPCAEEADVIEPEELERLAQNEGQDGDEGEEEEAYGSANASAPKYASLSVSKHEPQQKLWRAIMRQLRRLCADARPEVRTAAMHSLTSVLTAHGAALSAASWEFILLRLLMPLMAEVAVRATTADASETVAPTLGTEGGRPVHMLIHHSRDTESKQWDDTWVLALGSLCRLFRTFLPLLQENPSFDRAWEQLLSFCEKSLLSLPRSSEVALAAVGSILDLMASSVAPRRHVPGAPSPSHPPPLPRLESVSSTGTATGTAAGAACERARLPLELWRSVWGMLEHAVGVATESSEAYTTHRDMLTKLVKRLSELYKTAAECFEKEDVLRLLQLVDKLGVDGVGWDPLLPPQSCTPLHDAMLGLLEALPSFPPSVAPAELWQILLWQLLKFIQIPAAIAAQIAAGTYTPPEAPPRKKRSMPSLAEQAHTLLMDMLIHRADPTAQAGVFDDVMQVLRSILAFRLRSQCLSPALPEAAANMFIPLVHALLPALTRHSSKASLGHSYEELVDTVWMVLSPPTDAPAPEASAGELLSLPHELSAPQQELEVAVLHGIPAMLRCPSMSAGLRLRLLQPYQAVLAMSVELSIKRDVSWRASIRALCALSASAQHRMQSAESAQAVERAQNGAASPAPIAIADESSDETAKLAAPLLVELMASILQGWSAEASSLGGLLGPRAAQLLHALNLVANLTVPEGALLPSAGARACTPPCSGSRGHLVRLAPSLISCVGQPPPAEVGDALSYESAELQLAVRTALLQLSEELGL